MNETCVLSRTATADDGAAAAIRPADRLPEPLERLEARICELAGHLAAATSRFLTLVAEFDARRGWAEWDMPSCSAWLAWKCQLAPGTAREHVRVARALPALPVIAADFAAGRMSYAKVRALTRIAAPDTEAGLAELAGPMTAGQLERFARAHRKVTRAKDEHAYLYRRLTWRQEEDGSLSLTVRLPPADGAVVLKALRSAVGVATVPPQAGDRAPDDAVGAADDTESARSTCTPAGLADAFVSVAAAYLGDRVRAASSTDVFQVIVHAGPEALTACAETETEPAEPVLDASVPGAIERTAGVSAETRAPTLGRPIGHPADPHRCHLEDGPAISPAVLRMIACSATVRWMLHHRDGNALDVGRRRRTPPNALTCAVRDRDRCRCRYPGCNSRSTEIHHIEHWADGGPTKLDNLMLLCKFHHFLIHDRGYGIIADGREFTFTRPTGATIPNCPALPAGAGNITGCHDADIRPDTIIPAWYGDKLDLDLAIWACFANAGTAEKRRQQEREMVALPRTASPS